MARKVTKWALIPIFGRSNDPTLGEIIGGLFVILVVAGIIQSC